MAYKLNKTNGSLLVDLIDGTIDINSTSLTLVGRNYTGYGEAFNENFIKLLENFSNSNSPSIYTRTTLVGHWRSTFKSLRRYSF